MPKKTEENKTETDKNTSTEVETKVSEEEIFQSIGKTVNDVNLLKEKIKKFVVEAAEKGDMSLGDVRKLYTDLRDEVTDIIIKETIKWEKKKKNQKTVE